MDNCKNKSIEIDSLLKAEKNNKEQEMLSLLDSIKVQRGRVEAAIAEGDLSENAAYHTASSTISRLEEMRLHILNWLDAYKRYDNKYQPLNFVSIGTTVRILNTSNQKSYTVKIVPHELGDAEIGAISPESAVGKSILTSKTTGSTFIARTEAGDIEYRILAMY